MKIGKREFDTCNNTYTMGILNITPDSFYDGGKWNNITSALKHTEEMIEEGADIIDIGGESTRPGYTKITSDEEIDRIVPVITEIKKRFDIPVSVDTYKSDVARAALDVGADLINDIWGLKYDGGMGKVISEYNVPCCLMHNKSEAVYDDFIDDLKKETLQCVKLASEAGIDKDKIILDPGVGFGKTYEMNLSVLANLGEFVKLGYPVLLGCSGKSVIGNTLDLPKDERIEGTLVTTVLAVQSGCSFVRVHNIKENIRAIKMTKAIMRAK